MAVGLTRLDEINTTESQLKIALGLERPPETGTGDFVDPLSTDLAVVVHVSGGH